MTFGASFGHFHQLARARSLGGGPAPEARAREGNQLLTCRVERPNLTLFAAGQLELEAEARASAMSLRDRCSNGTSKEGEEVDISIAANNYNGCDLNETPLKLEIKDETENRDKIEDHGKEFEFHHHKLQQQQHPNQMTINTQSNEQMNRLISSNDDDDQLKRSVSSLNNTQEFEVATKSKSSTIEEAKSRHKRNCRYLCHHCNQPINDRFLMQMSSKHYANSNANDAVGHSQVIGRSECNLRQTNHNHGEFGVKSLNGESIKSRQDDEKTKFEDENSLLFHEQCLRCSICDRMLNQNCFTRDSKFYCPQDYYR